MEDCDGYGNWQKGSGVFFEPTLILPPFPDVEFWHPAGVRARNTRSPGVSRTRPPATFCHPFGLVLGGVSSCPVPYCPLSIRSNLRANSANGRPPSSIVA